MVGGDGIGRRIATYRRRRGLSQAALAGLVGRSESWLSQVERGVRSVDSMSVLLDLARILHVEVEALIGRPWQLAPNGNTIAGALADVRVALTSYNSLQGRPSDQVLDLSELRSKVAEVHRIYQAARYDEVMTALPDMLRRVLWTRVPTREREPPPMSRSPPVTGEATKAALNGGPGA